MSEENNSPIAAEKKKRHAIPVSVFVGVVLFILISATVVSYAFYLRKKLISDLDKRLSRRRDKILALDTWSINALKTYSKKNKLNDEQDYTELYDQNRLDSGFVLVNGRTILLKDYYWDTYDYRNLGMAYSEGRMSDTYKKDGYSTFSIPDIDFSYSDDSTPYATLLVDPDEDSYFVKNDVPFICYGGYIYRNSMLYDSRNMAVGFAKEGLNVQSIANQELRAAAFSIMDENDYDLEKEVNLNPIFGFEGTYRYCLFRSMVGFSRPVLETNDLNRIDTDLRSDFIPVDFGGVEAEYTYYFTSTVIFLDAGPELTAWKKQVAVAGAVGLGIYFFLLSGTILLEKRNREIRREEKETSENEVRLPGKRIHSDLADELLEKIDAAETSMGPNGYLEEIRDTIEKMKK